MHANFHLGEITDLYYVKYVSLIVTQSFMTLIQAQLIALATST